MRDALRANDQELYFRLLARTDLLLPVSRRRAPGQRPAGWGTWTTGGRTHVLAFTSAAALRACLGEHAGGNRRDRPITELAVGWPNHEWWLAVNPGLPIEGYLPAWFVSPALPGRRATARPRHGRPRPAGAGRDVGPDPARRDRPRDAAPPLTASGDGGGPSGPESAPTRHPDRPRGARPPGWVPRRCQPRHPASRPREPPRRARRRGPARRRSAAPDRAAPAGAGHRSRAPHRPAVPVHPVGDRQAPPPTSRARRGLAGSTRPGRRRRPRRTATAAPRAAPRAPSRSSQPGRAVRPRVGVDPETGVAPPTRLARGSQPSSPPSRRRHGRRHATGFPMPGSGATQPIVGRERASACPCGWRAAIRRGGRSATSLPPRRQPAGRGAHPAFRRTGRAPLAGAPGRPARWPRRRSESQRPSRFGPVGGSAPVHHGTGLRATRAAPRLHAHRHRGHHHRVPRPHRPGRGQRTGRGARRAQPHRGHPTTVRLDALRSGPVPSVVRQPVRSRVVNLGRPVPSPAVPRPAIPTGHRRWTR